MSFSAKFALLFIIFPYLLGQGLVFPIINALIMEPSSSFLPSTASDATRQLNYGLVIGIFFLMWFCFSKSNGITDGFHNKMEMISRRAYGFRTF